jgi:signal transduction histidine kinase
VNFRVRILIAIAAAGLVPLLLGAFSSFSANREELERAVGGAQAATAAEAARGCERFFARGLESLRMSARMLPVSELSREELRAVLAIPYRQLDFVQALAIFDDRGSPLAPPLTGTKGGNVGDGQVQRFLAAVPLLDALDGGVAVGAPYRSASGARVAVAVQVPEKRVVLAAEVAFSELEENMRQIAGGGLAALVDGKGEVLAGSLAAPLTPAERELVSAASPDSPLSRVVAHAGGEPWLASAAAVPQLGWTVLVAQPAAVAFRPALRVRQQTIYWGIVALALIAVLGLVLSRQLTGPIEKLSRAAARLEEGHYETELDIHRSDEIGRFADTFRHMIEALKARDEVIQRWNTELQERVEQRTRELQAAQDQVLRTRRLAALGSLGAGAAHQINNPLTAVTALITLLRNELPEGSPQAATAQQALQQAFRVAQIVSDLRVFSEQERGEGRTFPLEGPVRAALALHAGQMARQNIRLDAEFAATSRHAHGDPAQIECALSNLLQNAVQAMPAGGELRVRVREVNGEALSVSIADSGKGIPSALRERIFDPFFTAGKGAAAAGMGLSVAHSIVEAHHGRIMLDSEEGKGATFTIFLPAAAPAAHLA